jgi:hypothetical protein
LLYARLFVAHCVDTRTARHRVLGHALEEEAYDGVTHGNIINPFAYGAPVWPLDDGNLPLRRDDVRRLGRIKDDEQAITVEQGIDLVRPTPQEIGYLDCINDREHRLLALPSDASGEGVSCIQRTYFTQ